MSDVGEFNYDKDEEFEEFDDYVSGTPSEKSKGSVKKGLGIGFIATVVFELVVGLLMDAQHNLVHRYIAYMLGIVVLFIVSVYAKSTWKMIFFGTPMVIGLSFALPLAAPEYFAGLLSPFVNIFPTLIGVLDSVENLNSDTSNLREYADLLETYGFLIDFVFAMFVGTFAGIGLVGFVKIFSNKANILTIVTFVFSTVFFLLGVVILPYLLVVASGVSQFGLAFSAGTLNLAYGFQVSNQNGTDAAEPYFDEAQKWFDEAEELLQGLQDLQVFTLLGTGAPDYKLYIETLLGLIDTAVNLAQSVGPMFLGLGAVTAGISQSMAVIQGVTQNLNLNALNDTELAEFDAGIDTMKEGFAHIKEAIPEIQEALLAFYGVDINEVREDDTLDLNSEVDTIDASIRLVNVTLLILDVLISPFDTSEEPFVHLLKGALALNELSTTVGENSDYRDTESIFLDITGNLTVVGDALDEAIFSDLELVELLGVEDVEDLRNNIRGMFEFLTDTANTAISISDFGLVANPALNSMNATMKLVRDGGGGDFTQISQTEYDERLVEFNDTENGITAKAIQMQYNATLVEANITIMNTKAQSTDKPYGFMQTAGQEFATLFSEFRFQEDADNFYYMSHGLENTVRSLKRIALINSQVDIIQTEYDLLITYTWPGDSLAIQQSVTNINNTITEIQVSLDILGSGTVPGTLKNAADNFTLTTMKNTAQSGFAISNNDTVSDTDSIDENVSNIQDFKNAILAVTQTVPSNDSEFQAAKAEILLQINNISTEMGFVNDNAAQINIAA